MALLRQSYEQLHAQEASQRVYELETENARLRKACQLEWQANHYRHCCYHEHDPNADCRWPRPEVLNG